MLYGKGTTCQWLKVFNAMVWYAVVVTENFVMMKFLVLLGTVAENILVVTFFSGSWLF